MHRLTLINKVLMFTSSGVCGLIIYLNLDWKLAAAFLILSYIVGSLLQFLSRKVVKILNRNKLDIDVMMKFNPKEIPLKYRCIIVFLHVLFVATQIIFTYHRI
jgi:hypothetical protein